MRNASAKANSNPGRRCWGRWYQRRAELPTCPPGKAPPHGGFLGLGTVKDEGTAREQIPVAVRG